MAETLGLLAAGEHVRKSYHGQGWRIRGGRGCSSPPPKFEGGGAEPPHFSTNRVHVAWGTTLL